MRVIQNTDVATKPSDYTPGKIRVTSIFYTLQGEAPFSGYPAVFLRLAGCNWGKKDKYCNFCDTSFQFDQGKDYTLEELATELVAAKQQDNAILVVTGGEPSLQTAIIPLMEYLLDNNIFRTIQIESNLSYPKFWAALLDTKRVVYNVEQKGIYVVGSPKANNAIGTVPKPNDYALLAAGAIKILVDGEGTSSYELPAWLSDVSNTIYLSPVAVYNKAYTGEVSSIWDEELINKQLTQQNYERAARLCMEHGYRLSLQTHLFTSIA